MNAILNMNPQDYKEMSVPVFWVAVRAKSNAGRLDPLLALW